MGAVAAAKALALVENPGTMASSNGSATVAPRPRKIVLRGIVFRVLIFTALGIIAISILPHVKR
jgi:hypothetical protein